MLRDLSVARNQSSARNTKLQKSIISLKMPIIKCKTKNKKCRHLRWGLEKSPAEEFETVRIEECESYHKEIKISDFLNLPPSWFLAKQSSSQHVPDQGNPASSSHCPNTKVSHQSPLSLRVTLAVCSVTETVPKVIKYRVTLKEASCLAKEKHHLFLAAFSAPSTLSPL